eukprot:gene9751-13118_t
MIGPHGAGLMHSIFMRDRASLIELAIDGSSANRHFHNLALWAGKGYQGVGISNPVDCMMLKGIVQKTINQIDINKY